MDIAYLIRELILLNECVILRGIGGFETSYKNAVLDKEKKLISPPGKIIHFRPELVKDNGVLEDHLVTVLNIGKEEASEKIDKFVQEFHDTIRDKGKVFLEGIGEFTLAKDNSICFNEIRDENYLADSFGLDTLDIELESAETVIQKKPEPLPLIEEKRNYTGWYIAIGILLLLIIGTSLILVFPSSRSAIFNKHREKDQLEVSDVIIFEPDGGVKEDSTIKAIEQSIDEYTVPKKALAIDTSPAEKGQVGNKSYLIIAGSFKYQRNAERLKDMLLGNGFNPVIMNKGSYIRVVIGAFDDRDLAIAELQRIRNQYDKSVWLMEDAINH